MKPYPSPLGIACRIGLPSWVRWPVAASSHVCGPTLRGKMVGQWKNKSGGLEEWVSAAMEMQHRAWNQSHWRLLLAQLCPPPFLLTWRFVGVMNTLPGIVEASPGCSVFTYSSTQGRLFDCTDGCLDIFSVLLLCYLMKFIACGKWILLRAGLVS